MPDNTIGNECIKELRRFGWAQVASNAARDVWVYIILRAGANQRPSKVVYDREGSSIALAQTGDIDWDKAFEGVNWFHITGITPAISNTAMELSIESVKEAKKAWNYGFL